jgi:hypothetical protein
VKFPTGGDFAFYHAEKPASACFFATGSSRSGATPEPTVTVRMGENTDNPSISVPSPLALKASLRRRSETLLLFVE